MNGVVHRSWLALLAGWLLAQTAWAHSFEFTDAFLLVRADRTFSLQLTVDLDELLLGVPPQADSAEVAAAVRALPAEELAERVANLTRFFERHTDVLCDGKRIRTIVRFPEHNTPLASDAPIPTVFGVIAELSGRFPTDATTVQIRASAALPPLRFSAAHQLGQRVHSEILGKGVESEELPINVDHPAWRAAAGSSNTLRVAWQYVIVGFQHILPKGFDHILFVLGLFLASPRLRPLLWQVTAFTVAHSITLALAVFNVMAAPAEFVEPLIALSIAYVGIENLLSREPRPWRTSVVFLFGLLHGLGFAGVLREWGLPTDQFVTALVAFNIGVELGQLAVVGMALLAVGWLRSNALYRKAVILPGSAAIALIAVYLLIERTVGPFPGLT